MTTLTIIGIIVLILILGVYLINSRRPKFFTGDLKPLEKTLFAELKKNLDNSTSTLITNQLQKLKRGVRLYFEKSYNLELYDDKKSAIETENLFNRKDEFKLATLTFTLNATKYTAEFNTYSGRVWGITVRPNPKAILSSTSITVDKFKLNNDPTEKLNLAVKTEYYSPNAVFKGALQELQAKHPLTKVSKPLSDNQKSLFVKLTETKLPGDYLKLMNETNGFSINDTSIHGLSDLQNIPLDDNNYLVLADNSSGHLLLEQSKTKTIIKYQSIENESDSRDLGDNFIEALEQLMKIEKHSY